MMNKKGQELSTNTIIIVILAVVVLVVLALGFTMGWEKIAPWLSSNNIDNIKTACTAACSSGGTYDYCNAPREVKDGVNDKFTDTCYNLANNATYTSRNYGVNKCPTVTCA